MERPRSRIQIFEFYWLSKFFCRNFAISIKQEKLIRNMRIVIRSDSKVTCAKSIFNILKLRKWFYDEWFCAGFVRVATKQRATVAVRTLRFAFCLLSDPIVVVCKNLVLRSLLYIIFYLEFLKRDMSFSCFLREVNMPNNRISLIFKYQKRTWPKFVSTSDK